MQPHTTIRRRALSQDSPGPAKKAPGVCLQEQSGSGVVGGRSSARLCPEPPGALQVRRQRAGFRGQAVMICLLLLMTSLRFLSQRRDAREIPGGNDKQGVCSNLQRDSALSPKPFTSAPAKRKGGSERLGLCLSSLFSRTAGACPISASVNGGQCVVLILVDHSAASDTSKLKTFSVSGFHGNASEFPSKSLAHLSWLPGQGFLPLPFPYLLLSSPIHPVSSSHSKPPPRRNSATPRASFVT